MKRGAGAALIILAGTAAVQSAVFRTGTSWLQSVFLWITVALLTWRLLREG